MIKLILFIVFFNIGIIMANENQVKIVNWEDALSKTIADPIAGIKIAKLTGDDSFALYITELPTGKYVNAHYHKKDIETYQIISGKGLIHIGFVDSNDLVTWNKSIEVKSGDIFTIEPGMVHQLQNISDENLILIFGCPKSHLSTDRFIVKGHSLAN